MKFAAAGDIGQDFPVILHFDSSTDDIAYTKTAVADEIVTDSPAIQLSDAAADDIAEDITADENNREYNNDNDRWKQWEL